MPAAGEYFRPADFFAGAFFAAAEEDFFAGVDGVFLATVFLAEALFAVLDLVAAVFFVAVFVAVFAVFAAVAFVPVFCAVDFFVVAVDFFAEVDLLAAFFAGAFLLVLVLLACFVAIALLPVLPLLVAVQRYDCTLLPMPCGVDANMPVLRRTR